MQYFVLHKPYKMLSQFHSFRKKKCLSDIHYSFPEGVLPVGRLDENSEGLLIITNNRSVHHPILHPQFKKKKTYWVQVKGAISEKQMRILSNGMFIKNENKECWVFADAVRIIKSGWENFPFVRKQDFHFETTWLEIELSQGKNRQIRKMIHGIQSQCLRIIRISIGDIHLQNLKSGEVQEIAENDFLRKLNLETIQNDEQEEKRIR